MNSFALVSALVFEPRRAFTELDARPRWLFPALLLVLATVVMSVWYVMFVDLAWLTDIQMRNSPLGQNMTDEQIATMAAQAEGRRGLQASIGGIGAGIVVMIVLLVSAFYYWLATKITGVERSYRHWLALSAWSSLPGVLGVILSCVMLAMADSNQIGQEALQPLSVNQLLTHREVGEPGYTLYSSMTLLQLVSVWLAAVGLKVWSGRSWTYAIVVTILPWVLVYGIWAFFSLR